MSAQPYLDNYLAALEVAHSQLDRIVHEFESLQLRKEQIEGVVGALDPFLRSDQRSSFIAPQAEPVHYEFQQKAPVRLEPAYVEPARFAPQDEIVQSVQQVVPVQAEAVRPAAFSPMPEPILDPIQSRINRALGLAVA